MEVSVQDTRAEERFVHDLAQLLRVDSIRCTTAAGSGHPTSALSSADLMAAQCAWHLRYDWHAPEDPGNDHLIFSKGHASPPVSYTHLRAHETRHDLVCRLLLEKK